MVALSASQLDRRYGPPLLPRVFATDRKWDTWEENRSPFSMSELNIKSAQRILNLMKAVETGCSLTKVLLNDVAIIWIVTSTGTIKLALEEMFFEDDEIDRAKFSLFPPLKAFPKLGHPTLVDCGLGRIAGEICLQEDNGNPFWEISNASGRYGIHPSRRVEHLLAVKDDFGKLGINLVPRFISR